MSSIPDPDETGKDDQRAVVEQFNTHVPIGSPVHFWPGPRASVGSASRTRSEAWLLGDHTPVVLVEGYPGGIALTHVLPLPAERPTGGDS